VEIEGKCLALVKLEGEEIRPGAQRWTVALLTEAARRHPQMKTISRETIRRILKKTSSNPGGS